MTPRIEQIVNELLDAVADGPGFDLIAAFAGPLPTIVIAEMLGVDPADRLDFKRWSDDGVMAFDPLISAEDRERVDGVAGGTRRVPPPRHRRAAAPRPATTSYRR